MRGTFGNERAISIHDCGRIGYRDALELQHKLVDARREQKVNDILLLLEHPPVITMGRSAVQSDILADPATLEAAGATVEHIERGGEVTYHGPGQLVGYVILDLRSHVRSLRTFVNLLEEVFVSALSVDYQIAAGRDKEHRGVWVGDEKITAIGIAVQKRVTFHGFAFNVNTDLSHFDWIVPCGITDRGQTSLSRCLGTPQNMDAAKRSVASHFCDVFGYEFRGLQTGLPTP